MEDTYSRFSRVAENYVRYRPRYPRQLVEWLKAECGLLPTHRVADIGAGTGLLTELFLENGNRVRITIKCAILKRSREEFYLPALRLQRMTHAIPLCWRNSRRFSANLRKMEQ